MLAGITHVHLDGTHVDASIKLAKTASSLGVTISVHLTSLTKVHPKAKELLKTADYVCTDDVFVQAMIGEVSDDLEFCMAKVFETYCPRAKLMMATLPTGAAVLLIGQKWSLEELDKKCESLSSFPNGFVQHNNSLGYTWLGCKAWPNPAGKSTQARSKYDPTAISDVQVAGFINGVLQSYPLPMSLLLGAVIGGMSSRERGNFSGPTTEALNAEFPITKLVHELKQASASYLIDQDFP